MISGLAFFAASVYLMAVYRVLASLMAAVIGFTSLSLGVDLAKSEERP